MYSAPTDDVIARLGLLDPTAAKAAHAGGAKMPSLRSLSGRRIALLSNSKTNAAALLRAVGEALRERYGAAELIERTKLIYSRVAPHELIDELGGRCDAVVTAIGD